IEPSGLVVVHDLYPDVGMEQPRCIGERESAEGFSQFPQRAFGVVSGRRGRDVDAGDAVGPQSRLHVIAACAANAAVAAQDRGGGDATKWFEAPASFEPQVELCNIFTELCRNWSFRVQLYRHTNLMGEDAHRFVRDLERTRQAARLLRDANRLMTVEQEIIA